MCSVSEDLNTKAKGFTKDYQWEVGAFNKDLNQNMQGFGKECNRECIVLVRIWIENERIY